MKKSTAVLPEEWMRLVKGTMNLNVSKEEFKQFLEEKTQNNTITKTLASFYI
ncbi:anti-repressor SinI family protein [Priestia megaterium]